MQFFAKIEVHSTRLEIELAFKKETTCEYGIVTNTMLIQATNLNSRINKQIDNSTVPADI